MASASRYGALFDGLAERWRVIENEHDRHHPDRSRCGGVGGCSMMFAAVGLEQEMVDALGEWRTEAAEPAQCTSGHRLDHDHTAACAMRTMAPREVSHGC